jgi:[ribosomal protein S18]-alanine N-acetyltransferase
MFERIGWTRRSEQDRPIVSLQIAELSRVAHRSSAYFYGDLAETLRSTPHLAWRVQDSSEFIVGGYWRRRKEIGSVEELQARSYRSKLVGRLAQELRDSDASLLVVGALEQERNLSAYLTEGFRVVDEIVRYQRSGVKAPPPSPDVEIRPLAATDRAQLVEVDHASFPWLWWNSSEEFDWYLSLPGVEAYVAVASDRVVGYAGLTISGRQGHLDRLAVHSGQQGKGFGRALVCHTLNRMAQRRVERVALTTQVDNYRSASLYKSLGFTRTAVHYPIYGLWLAGDEAASQPE